MKKIQKTLLPYKFFIIGLIIILGSVGFIVKAAEQPTLEDVVNIFLSNLQDIGKTPLIITEEDASLGGIYHVMEEYYTKGICFDSGGKRCISQQGSVLKYTNDGGTNYVALNTSQSSTGGWNTDPTNNHIYTATNSGGDFYPVVIGAAATSSPADSTTELQISGGGELVVDGTSHFQGASAFASTLAVTGATTLSSTLASGALTVTGAATISSTLAVTGATTLTGATTVTGALTGNGSILVGISGALDAAAATVLSIGTSTATSIEIGDTAITTNIQGPFTAAETVVITGATTLAALTGSGNWLTTGNISGANGTFTGSLTVDTSTLIVNNTSNRVGIGSTTPGFTLSVLSTDTNQVGIAYDETNYMTLAVSSGGDLTITPSGADTLIPGGLSVGTSTASAYSLDVEGDFRINEAGATAASLDINAGTMAVTMGGALTITGALNVTGLTTLVNASSTLLTVSGKSWLGGAVDITGVATLTTDLVVDTNTLFVDASANMVGIGTTTPANQFEVHAATGTSTASFIAETAGSGGRIILEDSDGAGCSEIYILNGTITSATVACPAN